MYITTKRAYDQHKMIAQTKANYCNWSTGQGEFTDDLEDFYDSYISLCWTSPIKNKCEPFGSMSYILSDVEKVTIKDKPFVKTGKFITFEGIDGSGKSTQIKRVEEYLKGLGNKVLVIREPGGTELSESIRSILLDKTNNPTSIAETLLFEAARAQLTETKIIPALEQGYIVLCDRYYDSTLAYQSGGRKIDKTLVNILNEVGSLEVVPDKTFYLDVPVEVAENRVGKEKDRMEENGNSFMEDVRDSYKTIALEEKDRISVIDANTDEKEIFNQIKFS